MPSYASLVVLAALPGFALADLSNRAAAPTFVAPASSPFSQSSNYVGQSNGSFPKTDVVPGKVFDRFIQIWMENTDFSVANSTPAFAALTKQGILLNQSYSLTHPSEPNYVASMSGELWGAMSDDLFAIPQNISTVGDLLEDGGANNKSISWCCYQENMPTNNFLGMNFSSIDYVTPGAANYTFYQRKHNPCIIHNSIANNTARVNNTRNFNDLANDVNASAVPQWVFATPNMVNDGHDTDPAYMGKWLEYFLLPLLNDTRFNDNRTLILLTFDENETGTVPNQVFSVLLGGAIPEKMRGTVDSTYYTHYSAITTTQLNWRLKSLGRQDVNRTMSNVYAFVANQTGYKNVDISPDQIPLTNATGTYPGPLNSNLYTPFWAPDNTSVIGAGGQSVLILPGLNTSMTQSTLAQPVNLTSEGQPNPWSNLPNSGDASTEPGNSKGAAVPVSANSYAPVFAAILAVGTLFV